MAEDNGHRVISREYPDGRRIIAAVRDTDDPNQKSDEEILDLVEAHFERDQHDGE